MTPLPIFSRLGALHAPSTVLDEWGEIVFVNQAWCEAGRENGLCGRGDVGSNYPDACRRLEGEGRTAALALVNAIEDVARGWRDECHVEYVSNAAGEARWFQTHIWRWGDPGPVRVVVIHEDVTARRPPSVAPPQRFEENAAGPRRSPAIAIECLLAPIDDSDPERESRLR
jgi:hypothetical protein